MYDFHMLTVTVASPVRDSGIYARLECFFLPFRGPKAGQDKEVYF